MIHIGARERVREAQLVSSRWIERCDFVLLATRLLCALFFLSVWCNELIKRERGGERGGEREG